MSIFEDIFPTYHPTKERLIDYGFECFKDIFTYSINFHNNEFKALITVNEKGEVNFKVIELAFNEDFTQINNDSYKGQYIGEIRENCRDILLDIRNKCFKKKDLSRIRRIGLRPSLKKDITKNQIFLFLIQKSRIMECFDITLTRSGMD